MAPCGRGGGEGGGERGRGGGEERKGREEGREGKRGRGGRRVSDHEIVSYSDGS